MSEDLAFRDSIQTPVKINNAEKYIGLFLVYIIFVAYYLAGFAFAYTNQENQCYETKCLMSLSEWLLAFTLMNLILWTLISVVGFVIVLDWFESCRAIASVIHIAMVGLNILLNLVMDGIGVVELIYQFSGCQFEVTTVCVFVVISIVITIIFLMCLFKDLYDKGSHSWIFL